MKKTTIDIFELLSNKKRKQLDKIAIDIIKDQGVENFSFNYLIYDIIFYSYSEVEQNQINCFYKILNFFANYRNFENENVSKIKKLFLKKIKSVESFQDDDTFKKSFQLRYFYNDKDFIFVIPKDTNKLALIQLIKDI